MRVAAMYLGFCLPTSMVKLRSVNAYLVIWGTDTSWYLPENYLPKLLKEDAINLILGYGIRLVNSYRRLYPNSHTNLPLPPPAMRLDAVCAIMLLILLKLELSMSNCSANMLYMHSLLNGITIDECYNNSLQASTALYVYTIVSEYLAEGQTNKFMRYTLGSQWDILYWINEPRPEPVPPFMEWVIITDYRLLHFYDYLRRVFITCSMYCFPIVYCPRMKLFALSYLPLIMFIGPKRFRSYPVFISSMADGYRSMWIDRGVSLPDELYEKSGEGFPCICEFYYWGLPSGDMLCQRQKSCQQELATWTPH